MHQVTYLHISISILHSVTIISNTMELYPNEIWIISFKTELASTLTEYQTFSAYSHLQQHLREMKQKKWISQTQGWNSQYI